MNNPKLIKPLDELANAIQRIRDAEKLVKSSKLDLNKATRSLSSLSLSREEEDSLVSFIYWTMPDVGALELKKAVFGESEAYSNDRISKGLSDFQCDRCLESIELRSRSHFQELKSSNGKRYAEGYSRLCDSCWGIVKCDRDQGKIDTDLKFQRGLEKLRNLPYSEYLKSEHWQSLRKARLKWAKHKCQLCNKGGVLDLHHRTYENLGNEEWKDIIVLCRPCHSKHHNK